MFLAVINTSWRTSRLNWEWIFINLRKRYHCFCSGESTKKHGYNLSQRKISMPKQIHLIGYQLFLSRGFDKYVTEFSHFGFFICSFSMQIFYFRFGWCPLQDSTSSIFCVNHCMTLYDNTKDRKYIFSFIIGRMTPKVMRHKNIYQREKCHIISAYSCITL